MTTKVTKKQIKGFLKGQLASNKVWAQKGLVRIFEFQTADEQDAEHTHDHNSVGFTGVDGHILTSMAKQYINKGWLSEKQMAIVFKKMPKYWEQLLSISDRAKLEMAVVNSLN